MSALMVVALAVASVAAMALAAGGSESVVASASNSKLGERIVVSESGRTLYELSPETTSHLLCKSSECLSVWPPLTVSSGKTKLKAGAGVHGTLGILRRSNGALQVTLSGIPLYFYAGDSAKGQVKGQGLKSFGGTWHVVSTSGGSTAKRSTKPADEAWPAPSDSQTQASGGGSMPASGGSGQNGAATTTATAPSPATTPTSTTPTTTQPAYPKEEKHEETPKKEETKSESW